MDEVPGQVSRRLANSGRVSYGEPVVLHDTSKTRVICVPFFIPRSTGTDLAIKVVTYRKGEPPAPTVLVEEKSVSLEGPAALKLLRALREHLAVAEKNADGEYLVLPLAGGATHIAQHDPAAVTQALMAVLSSPEIVRHLAGTNLSVEITTALRGAIRLSEMRNAVVQLRELLANGEAREAVFQQWCERHSWAFGNAYVVSDDVREISPGDHLDLLLPTVVSGYRDIVELKRPDMPVLNYDDAHRNYYFTAEASRAIGQCHRYLDVLQEVASQGLRDHPEIVAYHPRGMIVIGRSHEWSQDKLRALHGLNRRLSDMTVITYDQLLAQGERLIEMFAATRSETDDDSGLQVFDPDEIPF